MTNPPRSNRRRQRPKQAAPGDIWRTPEPLPDVQPIALPDDAGALLRSLGDPPSIGGRVDAGHYFTAVVERAAALAAALALTADLLAEPTED